MDKSLRQIIREEVYKVMNEIGEEDPVKLAQDMIKSNEEQIRALEDELKFRENDARVQNLPRDEKDARIARAKVVKDRLERARNELELAKQSEINAVKQMQMQANLQTQDGSPTQIEPQT